VSPYTHGSVSLSLSLSLYACLPVSTCYSQVRPTDWLDGAWAKPPRPRVAGPLQPETPLRRTPQGGVLLPEPWWDRARAGVGTHTYRPPRHRQAF